LRQFLYLKDAGATSIYGNRGANGVIIVTTKRRYESPLGIKYCSTEFYFAANKVQLVDELSTIIDS
jgi:TonB-dependent SusC/RagA subfamily outer membrane receptor